MEKFVCHCGIVAPVDQVDVNTDVIIPKQFLKSIYRTGYGENLFDSLRYLDEGVLGQGAKNRAINKEFPLNFPRYADASILLTQRNFGCGSSREHAVWALRDYGFRALIAPRFADIFASNCVKNGVLAVELPETTVKKLFEALYRQPNYQLTIDLQTCRITSDDGINIVFTMDPSIRERLLHGWDDIAVTLQEADAIHQFELQQQKKYPWLWSPLKGQSR